MKNKINILLSNYLYKIIFFIRYPNKFRYWLHKYLKTPFHPVTPDFPKMVLVETSNYCNFSCLHCAYKLIPNNNHGFIDYELYKKIIDEMSDYKHIILRPFNRGEPLMNPHLANLINYAKNKGIYQIWLNTNGSLLNEEKIKDLIDSGLDTLEVSIDAFTEETFSKIKGVKGHILKLVTENTINFSKFKNKIKAKKPKLVVSFVESKYNFQETDDFIRFWKPYVDQIRIRPAHQHGALIKEMLDIKKHTTPKRFPCSILWERTSIYFNGDLVFCELDWEGKGIMGNLKKNSIKEIWHSKKYYYLRKAHIENKFSQIHVCGDCKSWNEAGAWI